MVNSVFICPIGSRARTNSETKECYQEDYCKSIKVNSLVNRGCRVFNENEESELDKPCPLEGDDRLAACSPYSYAMISPRNQAE